jgi:subtilisin family serine protease
MFKIFFQFFLLIGITSSLAQESQRVWIYFKDKGNYDTKSISEIAKSRLTSKSIQRRLQKAAAEPFDTSDLPINKSYVQQLNSLGIVIHRKSKWLNAISAYLNSQDIALVTRLPFVSKVETVNKIHRKPVVSAEKSQSLKKIEDSDYGQSLNQNEMLGIDYAHDQGYHGEGVRIAIFDTGFSLRHEALEHITIADTWDFINGDPEVGDEEGENPQHDHGTQVLAILAGYKSGQLIGPAYASEYLLAKTEDKYSETYVEEDNWVAAAEWADSLGADIISSSVGYGKELDYTYQDMDGKTTVVTKAANLAVQKGISVFVGAGNEGSNSWYYIIAPADGNNVMAIGGVRADGSLWTVSSHGPSYDNRIKPDLMAQGTSVFTVSAHTTDGYVYNSGTSFACPLAAGAGAILLSIDPNLTPIELGNLLKTTSSRAENPDNDFGWGIIDLKKLLFVMFNNPFVEVSSFIVSSIKGKNELKWVSRFEIENDVWVVNRRHTGEQFQEIARIEGKKYSIQSTEYTFVDPDYHTNNDITYQLSTRLSSGEWIIIDSVRATASAVQDFALFQNYPNPFNSQTTITISLAYEANISLKLFDVNGRMVKTFLSGEATSAGLHDFIWDGKTDSGKSTASGTYYALLSRGDLIEAIKLLYLR